MLIDDATARRIASRLAVELAPPQVARRPLRIGDSVVGWLDDTRARRIARFDDVFTTSPDHIAFVPALDNPQRRSEAIAIVAAALAAEGCLSAWRDECYAVAPALGAPPWFLLERAAARYFGVATWAVHVNGIVGAGATQRMWLARRSAAKAIDPGMLDNLVGGGIAAGAGVALTLAKEAWEEAGIPEDLAARARPVGTLQIWRDRPDGLQRETIHVHDLVLADDFVPANQDGEVAAHRLVALGDAGRLIALSEGTDVVTADASLVVLDYLLREGFISPEMGARHGLTALTHCESGTSSGRSATSSCNANPLRSRNVRNRSSPQ
jgi:8-oxo-dGTP pyrophosphatase MutT (NUDIX family)